MGCPKLADIEFYKDRLTQVLKNNNVKSVTYAHMEVPCCFGLIGVIKTAIFDSGKDIPFNDVIDSISHKFLTLLKLIYFYEFLN